MSRLAVAGIGLAMVAAACTGSSGDTTTSSVDAPPGTTGTGGITVVAEPFNPSEVRFVAALERFDQCEAFLEYVRTEAMERVGPYGLGQEGPFFPVERFAVEDATRAFEGSADTAVAAAPATTTAAAGIDFSDTNVQVAGVDEPDIVKTDGTRILAITEGTLHYVDVSGDQPQRRGSLFLEGFGHRLFMSGDRALVFGSSYGDEPVPFAAEIASIFPVGAATTIITEIDLSDPDRLREERTLRLEGSYVTARAVDGTVRVVSSSFPAGLAFVYPSGPAAEEVATETNRRIIAESTLETWLPTFVLSEGDDVLDSGVVADCSRIHRPAEFGGFEILTVLTFSLDEPLSDGLATSVMARGDTVFATADTLYVTTNVWVPEAAIASGEADVLAERYETAIHLFDTGGNGPASYVASGSVPGSLLNQFSLGEHDGRLFVATTDGPPWGFREESESLVSALEVSGDRLEIIGQVGDLGRGERIFSTRFIGDQAYVVTFRQVDPLYVIDLSDPFSPRVTGELKIPGFSSYLHPLGDDLLLGVGQDATEDGFTTGAKVSLFDVSNPAAPTEVGTWVLSDGFSEVQWDHLAFLYWPPETAAVLPVQSWESDFHGAVVLDVGDGLSERGRVEHDPPAGELGASDCRQLTAADLGVPEDELRFFGDLRVQVCDEDDSGGAFGFYCNVIPAEELEFLAAEIAGDPDAIDPRELVGPGERLEFCYPEYEDRLPILRSLVIGDRLWTLSRRALQANSWDGLDTVVQVPLG